MKIGYEAGRGRTFTPSMNAVWLEEFNEMLNRENLSRNALTEKLIEDGLKFNRNEHILLETENLSKEQIALLSSKAGQQILKNVIKLLLGESSNGVIEATLQTPFHKTVGTVSEESVTDDVLSVDVELEKGHLKSNNHSSGLTAMEKLRKKVNQMNQAKEQL